LNRKEELEEITQNEQKLKKIYYEAIVPLWEQIFEKKSTAHIVLDEEFVKEIYYDGHDEVQSEAQKTI
jgi:predicted nucleotide-binding protein (sugar kinase/HSP70/actin superfamily)